jgi:hypothetical protein
MRSGHMGHVMVERGKILRATTGAARPICKGIYSYLKQKEKSP